MAVAGRQIWAVSRMEKNGPSYFCDCFTCSQAGVRLGIVVKEKDVFHVSVRANYTDVLLQFV
jgi:phage gp46-like protein